MKNRNLFLGYDDDQVRDHLFYSPDLGATWNDLGVSFAVRDLVISGDNLVMILFYPYNSYFYLPIGNLLASVSPASNSNVLFSLLSNPITTSADFRFDALKEPTVFELFDLLGRSLLRQQVLAGQASLHVNMQNMPSGIYFARLGGETIRFAKIKN